MIKNYLGHDLKWNPNLDLEAVYYCHLCKIIVIWNFGKTKLYSYYGGEEIILTCNEMIIKNLLE